MLIFEKNNQGYFEFDFNTLVDLTSENFAKEILKALESKYIKAVESNHIESIEPGKTDSFITVFIIDSGLIHYYAFHIETGVINVSHMPLHVAEWASKNWGDYI